MGKRRVPGVWIYLLAIVVLPLALAIASHALDSYRFEEMPEEAEDTPFEEDKVA